MKGISLSGAANRQRMAQSSDFEEKTEAAREQGRTITKINRFIAMQSLVHKGPAVWQEDVALLQHPGYSEYCQDLKSLYLPRASLCTEWSLPHPKIIPPKGKAVQVPNWALQHGVWCDCQEFWTRNADSFCSTVSTHFRAWLSALPTICFSRGTGLNQALLHCLIWFWISK